MHSDKSLYKLLLMCASILVIVAVALPATMQDNTTPPTTIPDEAFVLIGTLDSVAANSINVDSISINVQDAAFNPEVPTGSLVRIAGAIENGVFTAYMVLPLTDGTTPQRYDRDDDDFELRGVVEEVAESYIIISGQQITLANTQIEAPLTVGEIVKVEGWFNGGQFVAREIEAPEFDDDFLVDDLDDLDDWFDDDDDDGGYIPANCTASAPDGWVNYTIQSGESISSIAARSGSSIGQIAWINCISNPRMIVAGSSIMLPREPVSSPSNPSNNWMESSRSSSWQDDRYDNESSGSMSRSSSNNYRDNESSGSSSHSSSNS